MASLEGTQLWWNGKLNTSSDLLYYDKINVDIVHPPYARRDRNSSYFLKTRRGYQADLELAKEFAGYQDKAYDIIDAQIVWDGGCGRKNGKIYYMGLSKRGDSKAISYREIEDGCIVMNKIYNVGIFPQYCKCTDNKFFKMNYVKGEYRTVLVDKDTDSGMQYSSDTGVQINRVEGGAMRGYFYDTKIKENGKAFAWGYGDNPIKAGDYLVITGSPNSDGDGFCGQIRTIVGYNAISGELMLDTAWSGFKDGEDEVRGENLTYRIFSDWGEVLCFTSGMGITVITNGSDSITMCDFGHPTNGAECIISSAATTDRVFVLYDNGWIHFGGIGRDKLFDSGDAMYCGVDKSEIAIYRDFILALGNKKISIGVSDTTGSYYHMYEQSTTIGLKNRYAHGEYNGDFLFCSNDNRLLALKIASNTGAYMLEFEDVGQYINPYLKAMLPGDECYIGTDNNQLRIFINTVSNYDFDDFNTRTLILKYDTIFTSWTVDVVKEALIKGCYEGIFFGDSLYYRRGKFDTIIREEITTENLVLKPSHYEVRISAFLLENEDNGVNMDGRYSDLFSLAMLNKLIVLLGTGRYDNENTKIKITEYRNGYGYEQEIKSLTNNDWLYNIGAAYEGESIEISDCVLSDIKDGSNVLRPTCEEGHHIQRPIVGWCGTYGDVGSTISEHDYQLTDHSVCVNDEVYKMAPTMPLTIELGDQERFNSQIFVELISDSDDVINFGGFFANLSLAPLGHKGGDGEYLIEVDSGC